MSSFKISRVLISDAVDPSAIAILKERNIDVDLKTNLSKEQLVDTIRVCVLNFLNLSGN
jgi:hypothetical protein